MTHSGQLHDFVRESNMIEGIQRAPTQAEIAASERFLDLVQPKATDMGDMQAVFSPDRPLREHPGMNVSIGNYLAPPGGPQIVQQLNKIMRDARGGLHPWKVHVRFVHLHPYLDGNGRTGRMLWAWCMKRQALDPFALPFLHRFYYQTLEHI